MRVATSTSARVTPIASRRSRNCAPSVCTDEAAPRPEGGNTPTEESDREGLREKVFTIYQSSAMVTSNLLVTLLLQGSSLPACCLAIRQSLICKSRIRQV